MRQFELHPLVVRGMYTYIRNPMYLSFLLVRVDTLLLSANWFIGVPLLVWFWVMYLGRVSQEEQMMVNEFGDPYKAYVRSTGRLFPTLGRVDNQCNKIMAEAR